MVWIYFARTPGIVYSDLTIQSKHLPTQGIFETEWFPKGLFQKYCIRSILTWIVTAIFIPFRYGINEVQRLVRKEWAHPELKTCIRCGSS